MERSSEMSERRTDRGFKVEEPKKAKENRKQKKSLLAKPQSIVAQVTRGYSLISPGKLRRQENPRKRVLSVAQTRAF
jgi:hypothetical protein